MCCHKIIPLQAIAQIPDPMSRRSQTPFLSHALPSSPNMRGNPRTFPKIPCNPVLSKLPLGSTPLILPSRFETSAYNNYIIYKKLTPSYITLTTTSCFLPSPCYLAQSVTLTGQDGTGDWERSQEWMHGIVNVKKYSVAKDVLLGR